MLGERAHRRAIALADLEDDKLFYGLRVQWWHQDWAIAAGALWRQIEGAVGDDDVRMMLARLAGNDTGRDDNNDGGPDRPAGCTYVGR